MTANFDDSIEKDMLLNWIRYHKCQKRGANRYYMDVLLENIDKFPLKLHPFIIEEEIMREERGGYESPIIKECLMHLLKNVYSNKRIDYNNYNHLIAEFLEDERIVPAGSPNPTKAHTRFHSLSLDMKALILVKLIEHNGVLKRATLIGLDSENNKYFVACDNLYVQFGESLKELTRKDISQGIQNDIYGNQWKLMARTEKIWRNVALILENYGEDSISNEISKTMERLKNREMTEDQKTRARLELQKQLEAIQRPSSPIVEITRHSNAPPPYPGREENNMKKKLCVYANKCRHFAMGTCTFHHPTEECRNFGIWRCPGVTCRFIHPICKNDGSCEGFDCLYRHELSEPTILRRFRSTQNERWQQPRDSNEERGRGVERGNGQRSRPQSRYGGGRSQSRGSRY